MKTNQIKFYALAFAGSLFLASCGNSSNTENHNDMNHEHHEGMEHDHGSHQHSESNEREVSSNSGDLKGDLTSIMSSYFSLNESLVKDNASSAAKSSENLVEALKVFKAEGLTEKAQNEVNEILESATEKAEHIAKNASEIDHQREHLVSLSIDIKDLIAVIGTSQKLYEDFCPMANNNEGAIWISNKEEISNPYMGSSMPKCGKVNRVIE